MRLIGYLRVSTDRQAERGHGLPVQRAAIDAWAAEAGHQIIGWLADEGISGSNGLDSRLALAEALEAVRAGEADGIVVYRLDRLARDLILQEQLLADIRRMGGLMFSTSAAEADVLADDPDDPSRKMIRQILGAVSEYERAMIGLRMRAGRNRKRSQGGYAGHGSPAYGQRSEDAALVPDPDEQAVAAGIVRMAAGGAGVREIARKLNAMGVPSKRGGPWHHHTVTRVLERQSTAVRGSQP